MNYNLVIEVGAILMAGRRCLLLKDSSIEKMPTDLVGFIYKSVDLDHPETFTQAVHKWAREDLALGKCRTAWPAGARREVPCFLPACVASDNSESSLVVQLPVGSSCLDRVGLVRGPGSQI